MRKQIKSFVAFGLIFGLLAGCGNAQNQTKESNSNETQTSSTVSSEVVSSEVVENKYPEYLNLDTYRPIVKEGEKVTLTMTMTPSSAATTEPDQRWFYQFIEENMNMLEMEISQ